MRRLLLITTAATCVAALAGVGRISANANHRIALLEQRIIDLEEGSLYQPIPLLEERIIHLPEDGNQWHTTLFLRPEWKTIPDERRAESMFHSEPLLVSLKTQTHWHLTTTDSPEFEKFRTLIDATPCLLIQRPNGQVIYRESGPQLCHGPHSLTHSIRREIQRHCPDGRCLPIHPLPAEPVDEKVPEIVLPDPPKKSAASSLLFAALGLAGGVLANWKKNG